uniref:Chemosensory protein 1 n=1 Tax=Heliconius charithonia TaxID=33434 RepID=A0AA49J4Q9_HELCH|nr:chemosensory protein 1 [Heliconius charithonia]
MKCILLLGFLVVSVALAEKYSDKYDDFDIYEVINNKRLMVSYLKCFLDQGRCTPEGKDVKMYIKDAMETGCEKCTEAQRKKARIVVSHVRNNEKDYWEDIKKKYDPNNEYKDIYEAFLARDD